MSIVATLPAPTVSLLNFMWHWQARQAAEAAQAMAEAARQDDVRQQVEQYQEARAADLARHLQAVAVAQAEAARQACWAACIASACMHL